MLWHTYHQKQSDMSLHYVVTYLSSRADWYVFTFKFLRKRHLSNNSLFVAIIPAASEQQVRFDLLHAWASYLLFHCASHVTHAQWMLHARTHYPCSTHTQLQALTSVSCSSGHFQETVPTYIKSASFITPWVLKNDSRKIRALDRNKSLQTNVFGAIIRKIERYSMFLLKVAFSINTTRHTYIGSLVVFIIVRKHK